MQSTNMQRSITRLLVAGTLLAGSAAAQNQFLPIGSQIMDGSQNMVTVNLGFNFTMPGGAVVTSVDVDEHGRIVEVGSDPSDSSESTSEMTGNPTGSINVLWDLQSYNEPNSSVWFDTDNAGLAVVTWVDVDFTAVCTYQCQLYGDGRIVMVYDSRCPEDDGIIGVCPGNGATLPPQSNLDDAINVGPIVSTDPTVFEDFGFTAGVDAFDFPSSALEFQPSGAGGSGGWTVVGTAGVADPVIPFATTEPVFGAGCFVPVSYTLVPDGVGGYDVSSGPSVFDANIGALSGADQDDSISAIGLDLGFSMPFPDGNSYQFVDIDPNGRIIPTTLAGTFGDASPSILDITTDGYPYFFGLWSDWNVTEATSDGIYFTTNPGVSATFTWNNVAQFGGDPVPPCTWQITLFDGGSVVITHQDLRGYNPAVIGSTADDTAVGLTSGAAPDPGEIDLTALTSTSTNVAGYVYEFWDSSGTAPAEPIDLVVDTAELVTVSQPVQGGTWEIQAQDAGAATFGFYVYGISQQNVDLTAFGSPCTLAVSNDLLVFRLDDGQGNIQPSALTVPVNPALTGVELYAQSAVDQPVGGAFTGFAGLSFALAFTNAVKVTIGLY